MVAFLAEYAGGEIHCQEGEIADAQWFPVDRLPALPHRLSVARHLIDYAVAEAARSGAVADCQALYCGPRGPLAQLGERRLARRRSAVRTRCGPPAFTVAGIL